jgi:hypothetical protein
MRVAQIFLRLCTVVACLYLAFIFGNRFLEHRRHNPANDQENTAARQAFLHTYGATDVRILQFYARDRELVEGHTTVLCYGVLNAKAVRIEPPLDGVWPALNRCVDASPLHDTRYKLTAVAADGHEISESFTLPVVPDIAALPRITSFGIANKGVDQGRPYFKLSFTVENAETVEIDPPVIPILHRAPLGQFVVAPVKNTTYTLTVTDKHGHKAKREVKVTVEPNQL